MSQHTPKKTGSIIIFGTTYSVEYYPLLEDSDGNNYGETQCHEKAIKVSLIHNDNKKKLQSTLFHEIIHGVLGESGLTEVLDSNTEEAIVVALENALIGKIVEFKPHVLKKATGDASD